MQGRNNQRRAVFDFRDVFRSQQSIPDAQFVPGSIGEPDRSIFRRSGYIGSLYLLDS